MLFGIGIQINVINQNAFLDLPKLQNCVAHNCP